MKFFIGIVTIPFKVLNKLAARPLTDKGVQFLVDDWNRLQE